MALGFLWKPQSEGQLNPGATSVLIGRPGSKSAAVYDASGNLIENLNRSSSSEVNSAKYYSNKPGGAYGDNLTVRVTYDDGTTEAYPVESGAKRYAGNLGDPNSVSEDTSRPANVGGYNPGSFGFGSFPADLTGEFPDPFNVKAAPYKFTDPFQFASDYGEFSRGEISKNYDLSKNLALDTLDTELLGLENYAPAAAALKRGETAADNLFNQFQRTQQIDSTLPNARADLAAQGDRARALASGRLPSSVEDRAYEVGIRSASADRSAAGGFGAQSSVARKASDLMSAEQRLNLSKYGDQLTSQNLTQSEKLLLAPTEYSNAGSQISVMPSISASQLTQQNQQSINNQASISATNALTSLVGQNQFVTDLQQKVNILNAANKNQFALDKFGYQTGYAGALSNANQIDINTQFGLAQQARSQGITEGYEQQKQRSDTISSIIAGVTGLSSGPGFDNEGSGGVVGDIISGIGSLFKSNPETTNIEGDLSAVTPYQTSISGNSVDTSLASGQPYFNDGSIGPTIDNAAALATPEVQSFSSDTGIDFKSLNAPQALQMSSGVLKNSGISSTPAPDMQLVGYDTSGKPTYGSTKLLNLRDPNAGNQITNTLKSVLDPTGALSEDDRSGLDKLGAVASDASFISRLSELNANGDTNGFINTLLPRVGGAAIKAGGGSKQTQEDANLAFSAYQLAQNWGQMSGAQKSIAVASLGIAGYKTASGVNLASKSIISPTIENGKTVAPGLNVGQALNLLQNGYNIYSVVNNWGQLNNLQKITGGVQTANGIAQTANQFGMLGYGTNGAAVPGVTQAVLSKAGLTSAPHFGVGAVTGTNVSALPQGYSVVSQSGNSFVAVPTANAGTSVLSALGTAAGVTSIAAGAYQVYKNWGKGGAQGRAQGAIGGSAMAAGLYTLGATNPFVLGGVIGTSLLGGSIKTGKSADQQGRDSVRSNFKEIGLSNDKHEVTLADGTKFNIGIDGRGDRHTITNRDLLSPEQKDLDHLNSYDTDYTNDLDYTTMMGGVSLSRIINGGKTKEINQLGDQLGNAALGNIGYNKEFTPENYYKGMDNLRAMYSQSGIKSKSDAYQLANQAYAEGRINDSDLISMHQAFNMIYDANSYQVAQNMLGGRHKATQITPVTETSSSNSSSKMLTFSKSKSNIFKSKEDIRSMNLSRYGVAA